MRAQFGELAGEKIRADDAADATEHEQLAFGFKWMGLCGHFDLLKFDPL
jgi:hypothetical protein